MAVGKIICYASVRTRVQIINIHVKQNRRRNQTRGSVHRCLQHWKMEIGALISFLGDTLSIVNYTSHYLPYTQVMLDSLCLALIDMSWRSSCVTDGSFLVSF